MAQAQQSASHGPGLSVLALAGAVDRELVGRGNAALQRLLVEHDDAVAIDISAIDIVNGAVLGLLLRASRRLAWRNRRLYVVCVHPDECSRLRIAGIDELATVVDAVPPRHHDEGRPAVASSARTSPPFSPPKTRAFSARISFSSITPADRSCARRSSCSSRRSSSRAAGENCDALRTTAPVPARAFSAAPADARAKSSRRRCAAAARSASGNSRTVFRRSPSTPSTSSATRTVAVTGLRVAGVGDHQKRTTATINATAQ